MFWQSSGINKNSNRTAKKLKVNNKKTKSLILALGLLSFGFCLLSVGSLEAQESSKSLRVVTRKFVPFVFQEKGKYVGFSVEIWDRIADEIGVKYNISEMKKIDELLEAVRNGKADIAVAGLTVTQKREQTIDFTHPFFETGLQILVTQSPNSAIANFMAFIYSPALLNLIGVLFLGVISAHLLWLFERHHNPDMFPKKYWRGIWESFWWAAVTLTTVGYGDKTPQTVGGRMVGLVWMFTSIILVSYFTAAVTSTLTVQRLENTINGPADLAGKRVATVRASTAASYLHNQGLQVVEFDKIDEAYQVLEKGEVQAVVYDAAVLRYYVSQAPQGKVRVTGPIFQKQTYGFALPQGSPYRETINRALLNLRENGTYEELYNKWFGVDES